MRTPRAMDKKTGFGEVSHFNTLCTSKATLVDSAVLLEREKTVTAQIAGTLPERRRCERHRPVSRWDHHVIVIESSTTRTDLQVTKRRSIIIIGICTYYRTYLIHGQYLPTHSVSRVWSCFPITYLCGYWLTMLLLLLLFMLCLLNIVLIKTSIYTRTNIC